MLPYYTCTENELTLLYPLGLMPTGMRKQIELWLHQHHVTATTVATKAPISRDTRTNTVTWFAQRSDGTRVRTQHRDERPDWPAPFSATLRSDALV